MPSPWLPKTKPNEMKWMLAAKPLSHRRSPWNLLDHYTFDTVHAKRPAKRCTAAIARQSIAWIEEWVDLLIQNVLRQYTYFWKPISYRKTRYPMPSHHRRHHLLPVFLPAIVSSDSVKLSVSLNSLNGISMALFRLLCVRVWCFNSSSFKTIHDTHTHSQLPSSEALTISNFFYTCAYKLNTLAYIIYILFCCTMVSLAHVYAHFVELSVGKGRKRARIFLYLNSFLVHNSFSICKFT